jgi:integrase/transposase-like protein
MIEDIECPYCRSQLYEEASFRVCSKEKFSKYSCPNCTKKYNLNLTELPVFRIGINCPSCNSANVVEVGKTVERKSIGLVQRCKCRDCKKQFILGGRKREKIYIDGRLIHTYWNPPGLQYLNYKCPKCQSHNTILKTKYWANKVKKNIIQTLCLDCGQKFSGEGRDWSSTTLKRLDLEVPIISWNFEDDIWDLRNFYPDLIKYHNQRHFIYFTNCGEQWFKILVKEYILYRIKNEFLRRIDLVLFNIIGLGRYLAEKKIDSMEQLSRELLDIYFLQKRGYAKENTLNSQKGQLKKFFNWGNESKKFQASFLLITSFDFTKTFLNDPEPLEDSVMEAIRDNISILPRQFQLMFVLGLFLGARPGELCKIKKDCIREIKLANTDKSNDSIIIEYWLDFERDKVTDEHSLPIPTDLVEAIHQQIQEITEIHGEDYPFLFCHYRNIWKNEFPNYQKMYPVKQIPFVQSLSNVMVKTIRHLIEAYDIRDSNGQLAKFTGAILRPSRASELIQNGYSLEFVRIWLGHRKASTTKRHYALYRQGELLDVAVVMLNLECLFYPYDSDPSSINQMLQHLKEYPELHEIDGMIMPNGEPLVGYCLSHDFCHKSGACYLCGFHIAAFSKLSFYKEQLQRLKEREKQAMAYWSAERLNYHQAVIGALEGKIAALEGLVDGRETETTD